MGFHSGGGGVDNGNLGIIFFHNTWPATVATPSTL